MLRSYDRSLGKTGSQYLSPYGVCFQTRITLTHHAQHTTKGRDNTTMGVRDTKTRVFWRTEQDKTRQDKTRQDKTRQDKTRQDKTRQDKTRQDKTRQDKTRQDKTRQDKTRQDKTRQENTHHEAFVPVLDLPLCERCLLQQILQVRLGNLRRFVPHDPLARPSPYDCNTKYPAAIVSRLREIRTTITFLWPSVATHQSPAANSGDNLLLWCLRLCRQRDVLEQFRCQRARS